MLTQTLRNLDVPGLLAQLKSLVGFDRRTHADMLRCLLEVEDRRAFLDQGFSSLWVFCHKGLGFSESMAQRRVMALRACRIAPEALSMIEEGRLNLCTLAAVAGVLTADNRERLLEEISGRSKREVEAIVAGLQPRSPPRDVVRPMVLRKSAPVARQELLSSSAPGTSPGEGRQIRECREPNPASQPQAEEVRTAQRVSFTASQETWSKIERLQEVLGHKDLDQILGQAADALLDRRDPLRRQKRRAERWEKTGGGPAKPRGGQPKRAYGKRRAIPTVLGDTVLARDGARCSFVSPEGVRCGATTRLELDHVHPWALGGPHSPENLRTLCRAHHPAITRETFGRAYVEERIITRRGKSARESVGGGGSG